MFHIWSDSKQESSENGDAQLLVPTLKTLLRAEGSDRPQPVKIIEVAACRAVLLQAAAKLVSEGGLAFPTLENGDATLPMVTDVLRVSLFHQQVGSNNCQHVNPLSHFNELNYEHLDRRTRCLTQLQYFLSKVSPPDRRLECLQSRALLDGLQLTHWLLPAAAAVSKPNVFPFQLGGPTAEAVDYANVLLALRGNTLAAFVAQYMAAPAGNGNGNAESRSATLRL